MLNKLILNNFANHSNLEISFKRFNFLYGQNDIGKTNLLEAIYFFTSFAFSYDRFEAIPFENKGSYAFITAFFVFMNEKIKQKLLFQDKKIFLYHQDQKKELDNFYGWLPIVYFGENTNLLVQPQQRELFLNTASKQMQISNNALLQELNIQIKEWKTKITESKIKNAYELQEIQEKELQMSKLFYSITKTQRELISFLNKEIDLLFKFCFSHLSFVFLIELKPWSNIDCFDSAADFLKKTQNQIFKKRLELESNPKEQEILINNFDFCFSPNKYWLSESNKKISELILQIALANLLQHQKQKEVIFLLDNFFYFDSFNQKQILKNLKTFKQFIITTNEKKSLSDSFLPKDHLQILKIVKNA